jgi:N-acetylglucosaminyldiphosphoundecaprenol N-acetyl-beta-D-mannosaminyltransferase
LSTLLSSRESAALAIRPTQGQLPEAPVLGMNIVAARLGDFAHLLARRALAGEGAYVVTVNLEHIARAGRDPAYDSLLRAADLYCPDGAPIFWACRSAAGAANDNCERITGVDLAAALLRNGQNLRFAIVGGRDPKLALRRMNIDEAVAPYINTGAIATDDASLSVLAAEVAAASPHVVFVALGIPRQDVVGLALRRALPGAVIVGVGGAFEMLAGIRPRAPRWVQRAGMEWFFRLSLEPTRLFYRYAVTYPGAARRLLRWAIFERRALPTSGG